MLILVDFKPDGKYFLTKSTILPHLDDPYNVRPVGTYLGSDRLVVSQCSHLSTGTSNNLLFRKSALYDSWLTPAILVKIEVFRGVPICFPV